MAWRWNLDRLKEKVVVAGFLISLRPKSLINASYITFRYETNAPILYHASEADYTNITFLCSIRWFLFIENWHGRKIYYSTTVMVKNLENTQELSILFNGAIVYFLLLK